MSTLKTAICILFTLVAINTNAQKNLQWGKKIDIKQKCGIYHTLEDLKNNKIEEIATITNNNIGYFMANKKFYMFKSVDFAGYRDQFGNRRQIIKGKGYIVLSYGKINLYSKQYGFNTTGSDGSVERNPVDYDNTEIFYSFSQTEEPVKLKGWDSKHNEKIADLFFKDNEAVRTSYINDVSDDYDYNVRNAFTDNAERLIHYVDIYNGLVK